MAIITEMNYNDVIDRARAFDRYDELGGYHGIKALFEYEENLSEEMGEDIELDIIGWCCDWGHYDNAIEAYQDYHGTIGQEVEIDEEDALDFFRDNTSVVEYSADTFIDGEPATVSGMFYQSF